MGVHAAVVSDRRCIADIPADEMIGLMELADRLRAQMGVSYPQDSYMQKLSQAAVGASQAVGVA